MATLNPARDALRAFVRAVDEAGGLVVNGDNLPAPAAEDGWADLGAAYIRACRALGVTPRYARADPPAAVTYPEGPATVNGDVREAIRAVLHYNWEDEKADAGQVDTTDGHVFNALVTIDNWLHGTAHPPEHHLQPDPEAPS